MLSSLYSMPLISFFPENATIALKGSPKLFSFATIALWYKIAVSIFEVTTIALALP